MIRKHSAKVLTLRNVIRSYNGKEEETLHFVLIGGKWFYNGTSSFKLTSRSSHDGFWEHSIKYILEDSPNFTYEEIIKAFYDGPNKSMQIATRKWTTNPPVYGVPF